MANVVEDIPSELRGEVDAAVNWLNAEQGHTFSVTGILDPEQALAQRSRGADAPLDLSLILCDGDLCVREQLRVQRTDGGVEVALAADTASLDPPAELDPLPGVRSAWLDEQLAKHEFVVLVFYRGFW